VNTILLETAVVSLGILLVLVDSFLPDSSRKGWIT
jgi:hypothetical protein